MEGGSGDMTLAFALSALQTLADPSHAFSDAREWTEYLGVVSEEPTYVVTNWTRQHRIRQDFFSGPRDIQESLASLKEQFDTERYVLVGTSSEHESIAKSVGWEYLPVDEAAAAAEWRVETAEDNGMPKTEDQREDWP